MEKSAFFVASTQGNSTLGQAEAERRKQGNHPEGWALLASYHGKKTHQI